MRVAWLSLALALVAGAASGQETFTCAGWTPRVGMQALEITAGCGEPESRVLERVPVRGKGADGSTYTRGYAQVERWTYGRKVGRPAAVLTFELTTLKKIEIKASR